MRLWCTSHKLGSPTQILKISICVCVCVCVFKAKCFLKFQWRDFIHLPFKSKNGGWGRRREDVLCGVNKWHCLKHAWLKEDVHDHSALQTAGTFLDGYLPKALLISRPPYWHYMAANQTFIQPVLEPFPPTHLVSLFSDSQAWLGRCHFVLAT